MAEMQKIEFTVSAKVDNAIGSLNRLINKLNEANSTAANTKGYRSLSTSLQSAGKSASKLSKVLSAVGRVTFYRAIRSAIKAVTSAFSEGLQNAYAFSQGLSNAVDRRIATALDGMTSAALKMKNQFGAAFGSLLTALAPLINTLISWITAAANAITQLFAALTGGTYLRAKDVSAQFADNMKKGAGAAKEWKNQLMGFDVINRLEEPSKGGGGSNTGIDPSDMFEVVAVESRLVELMQRLRDLAASIKINFKDVFFNWSDLNAESITKKLIVGLGGVLGGAVGFVIGGVPGALIGAVIGMALGLEIDALTFNNNGVLDKNEVINVLCLALSGLAGGAIGFFAGGGVGGAVIGAAIGVALFASLQEIEFLSGGKAKNLVSKLATALTIFAGAAIGFFVGGPAGALIGAAIGLGVSAVISSISFKVKDNPERANYRSGLDWFVCGVLGLPTNQELKEWGESTIDNLRDGLQSAFNGLRQWWSSLSLEKIHIPTPSITWGSASAPSWMANILSFFNLPPTIPTFNIAWNARGGIVDGATLIGAGEAGKEAIIPLERNTEWISRVASEINRQTAYGNDGGSKNDEIINAIFAVGTQIVNAIADSGGSGDIDWRAVAKNVTKYQNQMARAGAY